MHYEPDDVRYASKLEPTDNLMVENLNNKAKNLPIGWQGHNTDIPFFLASAEQLVCPTSSMSGSCQPPLPAYTCTDP
jgi:hypothetical protein